MRHRAATVGVGLLLAVACTDDVVWEDVVLPGEPVYAAWSALTATSPDTLHVSVTATNQSNTSIRYVTLSHQLGIIRVYREPDRSGTAVWDEVSWTRASPRCSGAGGCKLPPIRRPPDTLRPRETRIVSLGTAVVSDILGDSLPEGRYYFAVRQSQAEPVAKSMELPAGDGDLRRQ